MLAELLTKKGRFKWNISIFVLMKIMNPVFQLICFPISRYMLNFTGALANFQRSVFNLTRLQTPLKFIVWNAFKQIRKFFYNS